MREQTGDTAGLHRLKELQSQDALTFCTPAIQASEKQRDGTTLDNYSKFQIFIESLGLGDYEELKPPLYIGMGYVGHCVVSGPGIERLEREIHEILFPNLEFAFSDYVARLGSAATPRRLATWRNAKCDVLSIWSHIHYGADIFVTGDSNFHKASKKARLIALGAHNICTPSECAAVVEGAKS